MILVSLHSYCSWGLWSYICISLAVVYKIGSLQRCCADGFDSLQRQLGAAGYTGYDRCAAAVPMALTAYKGSRALLGIPDMTDVPLLCQWLWQLTKAAGRCWVYRIWQMCRCYVDSFDSLQRQLCAAGYTGDDSCAAAMLQAVDRSKGSWSSRHCLK